MSATWIILFSAMALSLTLGIGCLFLTLQYKKLLEAHKLFEGTTGERLDKLREQTTEYFHQTKLHHSQGFSEFTEKFFKGQLKQHHDLQDTLRKSFSDIRTQVTESLTNNSQQLVKRVEGLTDRTDERLKLISGQVEKRLTEGFEKTTATFTDIVKRLALIDEAQKKITELSTNMVTLQDILSDKTARGAFGEIQLSALVNNMLPEKHYALQHTLSNGKRVDCMLFLPDPTGNVPVDAKFPLEGFRKLQKTQLPEQEKRTATQQFRQMIQKHIQDIAGKYILPGETSEGAIMFVPAEAVFAEIHANHSDLVEKAYAARVWIASPTTLMAILTTARAVLKDADTRKQVHIIQDHLRMLNKDFQRFETRMDKLARHMDQANSDVKDVQTSARKISSRFNKIETVEVEPALEKTDPIGLVNESEN